MALPLRALPRFLCGSSPIDKMPFDLIASADMSLKLPHDLPVLLSLKRVFAHVINTVSGEGIVPAGARRPKYLGHGPCPQDTWCAAEETKWEHSSKPEHKRTRSYVIPTVQTPEPGALLWGLREHPRRSLSLNPTPPQC